MIILQMVVDSICSLAKLNVTYYGFLKLWLILAIHLSNLIHHQVSSTWPMICVKNVIRAHKTISFHFYENHIQKIVVALVYNIFNVDLKFHFNHVSNFVYSWTFISSFPPSPLLCAFFSSSNTFFWPFLLRFFPSSSPHTFFLSLCQKYLWKPFVVIGVSPTYLYFPLRKYFLLKSKETICFYLPLSNAWH